MLRAVVLKDVLWPQKQEDREEGGWKALPNEKRACDTRACDEPEGEQVEMGEGVGGEGEGDFVEQRMDEAGVVGLPVIAERLIEESVRGRAPRVDDSMV